MTSYEALIAQLQQLQRAIYDHEFEGAWSMSSREASEYRAELDERKAALLAEIDAAIGWGDSSHASEVNEARKEVEK